jgi:hypothetical protein
MKLLVVFLLLMVGIAGVIYPFQIVKTFGHMGWAEDKLGSGGSYMAWRLIGVLCIIGSYIAIRAL